MAVTIGTSATAGATYYPPQRKTFYANGYFWAFYSDGTNLVYRTSSDGLSWSSATTVRACAHGEDFSVRYFPDYNSAYVYYAYADGGATVYFCRGQILVNIINWGTEYVVESDRIEDYPDVCVGSDGAVYVGFSDLLYTGRYRWVVNRNVNNDGSGSWYSYGLIATQTSRCHGQLLMLTNSRIFTAFCSEGAIILYGRLWDGVGWVATETCVSDLDDHRSWQMVAEGDDVHLAYMDTTDASLGSKRYRLRDYSEATPWQAIETITSGTTYNYGLTLAIDESNGYLYCFWLAGNNLYYAERTTSWQSVQTWITGERDLKFVSINACQKVNANDKIGVIWTKGELSPYSVRYDLLDLAPPPPPAAGILAQIM